MQKVFILACDGLESRAKSGVGIQILSVIHYCARKTALRHRWTGLVLVAAESARSSAEPSLDLKEREGGRTQRGHSDHNDSER